MVWDCAVLALPGAGREHVMACAKQAPRRGRWAAATGMVVRRPRGSGGMVVSEGAEGQWTVGRDELDELLHPGIRTSDEEDGRGKHRGGEQNGDHRRVRCGVITRSGV